MSCRAMQVMFHSAAGHGRPRRVVQGVAAAGLLVMVGGPARAADDASAWDRDAHSALRLIAASQESRAPLRAGIEISLAPGWNTYWRYPGDAGVPPRFDFSGSQNVADVQVLWPAPKGLSEGENRSIGYTDHVILPLRIAPRDPGQPVTLALKADYAVCGNLCVPAQGTASLRLPTPASTQEAALAGSEARVPRSVAVAAGDGLAITAVTYESASTPKRLLVDVAAPAGASVDLFAEGPTPEWALPVPRAVPDAPRGLHRFTFDLDGVPPGATIKGAVIKLTAVSAQEAIEVETRLD
jgi:DsbC/DsbD-like thiol-disulfide interchange protein